MAFVLNGRRGNIPGDPILILVLVFVITLVLVFVKYTITEISPDIIESVNDSEQSVQMFEEYEDSFSGDWDALVMLLIAGFSMAAIVSAFAIRSHPMFYIFFIIILGVLVFVGADLANAFNDITETEELVDAKDSFVMSAFTLVWFPRLALVISIFIAIIAWSK